MVWHISGFEIDPSINKVTRHNDGLETRIQPKSMSLLIFLMENAGETITKEKIFETIWPDSIVTDSSLSRVITELRKVLGDDAKNPRYIKTIPKKGYRFIAEQGSSNNYTPKKQKDNRSKLYFFLTIGICGFLAVSSWLIIQNKSSEETNWQGAPKVTTLTFDENYNRNPKFSNSTNLTMYTVSDSSFQNDRIIFGDLALSNYTELSISEHLRHSHTTFALNDSHIAIRGRFGDKCEIRLYEISSSAVSQSTDCVSRTTNVIEWSEQKSLIITSEIKRSEDKGPHSEFRFINTKGETIESEFDVSLPKFSYVVATGISPDGNKIAYAFRNSYSAKYGLGILDLTDGSKLYMPRSFLAITDVGWSHDMTSLFYAVHGTSDTGIWRYDIANDSHSHVNRSDVWRFDTSNLDKDLLMAEWDFGTDQVALDIDDGLNIKNIKRLETPEENEIFPTFSPDGKFIAYASTKTGQLSLWLRDTQSQNSNIVKVNKGANILGINWSSNSQTLFLLQEKPTGERYVESVDLAGHVKVLMELHPTTRAFTVDEDKQLIYWSYLAPKGIGKIVVTDLKTKATQVIANQFAWGMKQYKSDFYVISDLDNRYGIYKLSFSGEGKTDAEAVFTKISDAAPTDTHAWQIQGNYIYAMEPRFDTSFKFYLKRINLDTLETDSHVLFTNETEVKSNEIQSFLGMSISGNRLVFTSMRYFKSNLKYLQYN